MRTAVTLSEADASDAEAIARHVEVPAIQNDPLYRTMFPRFDAMTEEQKEEIVRWYAETLEGAMRGGLEGGSWRVCYANDTPVGFCGWTIAEGEFDIGEEKDDQQTSQEPEEETRNNAAWYPETVDMDGWNAVSVDLRAERERVFENLGTICRKVM